MPDDKRMTARVHGHVCVSVATRVVSHRPPAECPAYRRRPLRERMFACVLGLEGLPQLQVDSEAGFWKKY